MKPLDRNIVAHSYGTVDPNHMGDITDDIPVLEAILFDDYRHLT